jgi:hypothetical protein
VQAIKVLEIGCNRIGISDPRRGEYKAFVREKFVAALLGLGHLALTTHGRMSWAQLELTNPISKVSEDRRGTGQIKRESERRPEWNWDRGCVNLIWQSFWGTDNPRNSLYPPG